MSLPSDRPMLIVGSARSFDRYRRDLLPGYNRPLVHIPNEEKLRGRKFVWEDIVFLWDAHRVRDFDYLYRYARHVSSIYDSRDGDESGKVRGRGEEPPRTDRAGEAAPE